MAPILLLILLAVVFTIVAIAFAWQERRVGAADVTIYSVEDSIDYVTPRLSPEVAANIKRSDVRRILEWEVRYLQDPALHRDGEPIVAGGLPSAEFAQARLAQMGYPYDGPEIIEVLDLRAEYLREIGAVGAPLTAAEIARLGEATVPGPGSDRESERQP